MAEVVGGFLMPHNPMLTSAPPGLADPVKSGNVFSAFEAVSKRVTELRADTVIIIGDDHYTNFGPHCIPRCLIATGDVEGPIEPWLGIEKTIIENNEALANHIMVSGFGDGIDWAFAKSITVDHSIAIPYHLAVRGVPGLKAIPVYLNAAVPPVIGSRRAFQIGESILRAVQSWEGAERVVIYGTGGISHWVGSAGMGQVNEAFDQQILAMAGAGDVEGLIALSDDRVLEEGGNGCLEIKNWICAMAALPGSKADLIAYEAMPEWVTGLGFAELRKSA